MYLVNAQQFSSLGAYPIALWLNETSLPVVCDAQSSLVENRLNDDLVHTHRSLPPMATSTDLSHKALFTMPLLFSYGTLQQKNVQLATFGRLLQGQLLGFASRQ